MNNELELSARDRARLYKAASEQVNDPVELIIQKAQAYDEAREIVKASLNLTTDADDLDLLTMVKGLIQTVRQANARIKALEQKVQRDKQAHEMIDEILRTIIGRSQNAVSI